MKKIMLNPEQLCVESFHVEGLRDGAAGTVHGQGVGGAEFINSVQPNTQCAVNTCQGTCETLVCLC
jgi:hypothetical protein